MKKDLRRFKQQIAELEEAQEAVLDKSAENKK